MACWFCGGDADVLTAGEIAERLETYPGLGRALDLRQRPRGAAHALRPRAALADQGDAFWQFLDRHPLPWLVRLAGGDVRTARLAIWRLRERRRVARVLARAA
jgi:hypothetical protein